MSSLHMSFNHSQGRVFLLTSIASKIAYILMDGLYVSLEGNGSSKPGITLLKPNSIIKDFSISSKTHDSIYKII